MNDTAVKLICQRCVVKPSLPVLPRTSIITKILLEKSDTVRQARERLYRVEAIVLKRQDFGEADRVLTLLTPDHGKLRAVAKGVRRTISRKAGHIELFSQTRLLLAKGRTMDVITQAEAVNLFRPLHDDLLRFTYASTMVELVDKFMEEGDAQPEVYDLLRDGLTALVAEQDEGPLPLLARSFELHLLSLVGYQPSLFACAHCQTPLEAVDQYFSPLAGGVLCPQCRLAERDALPLSLNALKVLRFLQTRDWAQVRTLRVSGEVQTELERLHLRYLTHVLERQLKSPEFLELIRRDV